jgi:hypothetical protein
MTSGPTYDLPVRIAPSEVHSTIARYMLADGEHLVIDLLGSQGSRIRDAATGREYLDYYTYFASQPVGHNHPKLRTPEFLERLNEVALYNPANSDVYTTYLAEFVETFARVARPPDMPHLFFVAGGTLSRSIGRCARTWPRGEARRGARSFTSERRSMGGAATRYPSPTQPTPGNTRTFRSSAGPELSTQSFTSQSPKSDSLPPFRSNDRPLPRSKRQYRAILTTSRL